ncbi:hypothetical protein H7Y63_01440 [Polaromonas sp.]|nr:hypothetical protein [Candidatus Saccharibacteria bacterium]
MSWQIVISAQIIVSSLMTICTRRLALTNRTLFFVVGVLTYGVIAVMGVIYSLAFGGGLPQILNHEAWPYLIGEGIAIPSSWLLQYKIISKLGASNAVLITMLNNIGAASLGILLLNDDYTATFFIGAVFICLSIIIAFRVQPDTAHPQTVPLHTKLGLVSAMVVLFALGMYCEKQAITLIGVWNYSGYGWGLQFLGAFMVFLIFGRHELASVTKSALRQGILVGLLTSFAGGLYIYALSIGTLSHTIVAASGKIALTGLLAAIFLHERNQLRLRLAALLLSITGILFLVS